MHAAFDLFKLRQVWLALRHRPYTPSRAGGVRRAYPQIAGAQRRYESSVT